MVSVRDNVVYLSQADDVVLNLHIPYDDMRSQQEYTLQPDDYIRVSIRYEASTYSPVLYETEIKSKLLKIPSSVTSKFAPGKYSMSIFLFRKQDDGTYFRQEIFPNFKYMKIPAGKEINTKTFVVNAISEYNE